MWPLLLLEGFGAEARGILLLIMGGTRNDNLKRKKEEKFC